MHLAIVSVWWGGSRNFWECSPSRPALQMCGPHVCECWRQAAARGVQAFTSYSPKTIPTSQLRHRVVGGVSTSPRVLLNAHLCAHQLRTHHAHLPSEWQHQQRSGSRDRPQSVSRHSTLSCGTFWQGQYFPLTASSSCPHTCSACARVLAPSGSARDAGVHELFIETHRTSQLRRWGGQRCVTLTSRAAEHAPVCATAAPHVCAPLQ